MRGRIYLLKAFQAVAPKREVALLEGERNWYEVSPAVRSIAVPSANSKESSMSENTVENEVMEVPEIDEELESLLIQVIEEARGKMEQGEVFPPFTAAVVGDKLFTETHEGTIDECFDSARDAVLNAAGARLYAFCYDGYIDTDEGDKDAIIAEGGVAGDAQAVAVGMMYAVDEEGAVTDFDDEVVYIAETDNFLADAEPVAKDEEAAEDEGAEEDEA